MLISYIKIIYSVAARTCYGFRGHTYHGENFEKITQYGEFGCIFLHSYAFKISHFLYKHNYIVSVEGSSIVMYIESLGSRCSSEKIFKKWHNVRSFSEYSDIILS